MNKIAVIIAVLTAALYSPGEATTWYVDSSNTTGPWDGSADHPFYSIEDAIGNNENLAPGDEVLVKPGKYGYVAWHDMDIKVFSDYYITGNPDDREACSISSAAIWREWDWITSASLLCGFTITGNTSIHAVQIGSLCGPTITGNKITNNSTHTYGSVFIGEVSSAIITDNIITDNTTTSAGGGGIYAAISFSGIIANNTISGNHVDGVGAGPVLHPAGGGIYCEINFTGIIENNIIENNVAHDSGGGIYCEEGFAGGIIGNTISGNSAGEYGGGIYISQAVSAFIYDNIITNNSCNDFGGGICVEGGEDYTIEDNEITDNNVIYGDGGGMYILSANGANIEDNTVSNNSVGSNRDGGGIYANNCSNVQVLSNTVSQNNYGLVNNDGSGGGICLSGCTNTVIFGNTVSENVSGQGGGIISSSASTSGSSHIVSQNIVTQNVAYGDGGGVLVSYTSGSAAIEDNIIEGNASLGGHWGGGGMWLSGDCNVVSNTVNGNSAQNLPGGGIYIRSGNVQLSGNTISENEDGGVYVYGISSSGNIIGNYFVQNSGGGLYVREVDGGALPIEFNEFSNNTAFEDGGGMRLSSNCDVRFNIIYNNSAPSDGGGIYTGIGNFELVNNTIFGNQAENSGGGLGAHIGSQLSIINTIFWNNSAPNYPQLAYEEIIDNGGSISYCDIEGYDGSNPNIINSNPMFCNADNSNFTLMACSPCVDEGDPNPIYNDPDGSRSDIGAEGPGCACIIAVLLTAPHANEQHVDVTTPIEVTFNTEMNPATFNTQTSFKVKGSISGSHEGVFAYENCIVTFTPQDNFIAGEVITVTLTTDLTSISGYNLTTPHSWSFHAAVNVTNGTFVPGNRYETIVDPTCMATCDFNNDNYADLVVGTRYYAPGNCISILLNNGDGTFAESIPYEADEEIYGICVHDFNGDGYNDIACYCYSSLKIIMNDGSGNGTFENYTDYPFPAARSIHRNMVPIDIENDGDADLAICHADLIIMINNGTGAFSESDTYAIGGSNGVTANDLNNDGFTDLALARSWHHSGDDFYFLTVLSNQGDGTFYEHDPYPMDKWQNDIFAADIDLDMDLDLVINNSDNPVFEGFISIMINNGGMQFDYGDEYSIPAPSGTYIQGMDMNGDGYPDLATSLPDSEYTAVLLNNTDGTFGLPALYPDGHYSYPLCAADYDLDGDIDLTSTHWAYYGGEPGSVAIIYNEDYGDYDQDDIGDPWDNCPLHFNPGQEDWNGDDIGDACDFYEFTPTGENIVVDFSDGGVTITFSNVEASGQTDLDITTTGPGFETEGYRIYPGILPAYYHISTTATFPPPPPEPVITICITIDVSGLTSQQIDDLEIQHWNGSTWQPLSDISKEQIDNLITICGTTNSLSPFIITFPEASIVCGDANGDETVNVADAVFLINYVFKSGPAPDPLCAGDANGDGTVNVADAVYLINYVFKSGPPPVEECCSN